MIITTIILLISIIMINCYHCFFFPSNNIEYVTFFIVVFFPPKFTFEVCLKSVTCIVEQNHKKISEKTHCKLK